MPMSPWYNAAAREPVIIDSLKRGREVGFASMNAESSRAAGPHEIAAPAAIAAAAQATSGARFGICNRPGSSLNNSSTGAIESFSHFARLLPFPACLGAVTVFIAAGSATVGVSAR